MSPEEQAGLILDQLHLDQRKVFSVHLTDSGV